MDNDEHSYSYDENDIISFGNDEASFKINNECEGHDNHSTLKDTATNIDNEHYFHLMMKQ